MIVKLYAPDEYWKLSEEEKDKYCNGCGGRGGKLNFLIPQGKFEECCNIHDYMYSIGTTNEDKRIADATFINNMSQVIKELKGISKIYYKTLSKIFYNSVKDFGEYYFWRDKVKMYFTPREFIIKN